MPILMFWREGVIALLVIACGFLVMDGKNARLERDQVRAALSAQVKQYRDAAAVAKANAVAEKNRIERDQQTVSLEELDAYRKKLADLQRRYINLRVRPKATTDSSGPGQAGVPGVPEAASGIYGTACEDGLPPEDALIASEIALRLEALQAWVTGQIGVTR